MGGDVDGWKEWWEGRETAERRLLDLCQGPVHGETVQSACGRDGATFSLPAGSVQEKLFRIGNRIKMYTIWVSPLQP